MTDKPSKKWRCSVHNSAASTAYGKGCRCDDCRGYEADRKKRGRKGEQWRTTELDTPRCPEHDLACSTAYNKRKCKCEACKAWHSEYGKECWNKDLHDRKMRQAWHQWKHKGGIASFEEYKTASEQDYCDCCGAELPDRSARCVDHCHETGRLRGTLCRGCNSAEGNLKTIARCEQLIKYIKDRCNV